MKLIGVKFAMAGFCEDGSNNVVSIQRRIFLKQFRVLSVLQEDFFSMDTFSHHHPEDKSKILDFSLRIHSVYNLRRFYNTNSFL
jgi:hypothetical protein